jgi:hypothetical protein
LEYEQISNFEKKLNSRRSSINPPTLQTRLSKAVGETVIKPPQLIFFTSIKEGDHHNKGQMLFKNDMDVIMEKNNDISIFKDGSNDCSPINNDCGNTRNVFDSLIAPTGSNIPNFFIKKNEDASPDNTILKSYIENIQNNPCSSASVTNSSINKVDTIFNIETKNISAKMISKNQHDESHTLDYSSYDEDRSLSNSPSKILRKFNVNPYNNFKIVKKFFIYQLKKSFLQAKKFMFNSSVHATDNNKNPTYFEIFTNYSQITSSEVHTYVVYDDHNIKINNYFIYKNKVLGKGGFSSVYYAKNIKDKKEYVCYILLR